VRELSIKDTQATAGGTSSDSCYEAYKRQSENVGVPDLLGIVFLPWLFLPRMLGKILTVKNICGSWEAYDEAAAAYCQANPQRCVLKK
jgi:hypothetical protein